MSACRFCGSRQVSFYTVRLNYEARSLMRCTGCLSCSLDEPFDTQTLESFYEKDYFQGADWQLAKSKVLARDYVEKYSKEGLIIPGAKVLEIGAAYGYFAGLLSSKGIDVSVLEMSSDGRDFIRREFPHIRVMGAVLDDLTSADQYDFIFCQHVLEHLVNPDQFLSQVSRILRPNGIFAALTPSAASASFNQFKLGWGWSCPEQHFEFLSPFIPSSYYQAIGFELLASKSLVPASIHYPSQWRVHAARLRDHFAEIMHLKPRYLRFPLRIANSLLGRLTTQLSQNMTFHPLLKLEAWIDGLRSGNDFDELLLVLKKREGRAKL